MRISDWSSDVCSSDLRAALLGIVRRDHWVILRQVPLGAIILGRHVVMRHQVAPQHLELLAVLKTYTVIGLDRCADRDGRLLFDFRCFDIATTCQPLVPRSAVPRNIRYSETVVSHICGNTISTARETRFLILHYH